MACNRGGWWDQKAEARHWLATRTRTAAAQKRCCTSGDKTTTSIFALSVGCRSIAKLCGNRPGGMSSGQGAPPTHRVTVFATSSVSRGAPPRRKLAYFGYNGVTVTPAIDQAPSS